MLPKVKESEPSFLTSDIPVLAGPELSFFLILITDFYLGTMPLSQSEHGNNRVTRPSNFFCIIPAPDNLAGLAKPDSADKENSHEMLP